MLSAAFIAATVFGLRVQSEYAETTEYLTIRGQPQLLHIYGQRGGDPVVVTSGDGGWIHLGVHVAEALAARGYFVVDSMRGPICAALPRARRRSGPRTYQPTIAC
jgi:hypothetical protein